LKTRSPPRRGHVGDQFEGRRFVLDPEELVLNRSSAVSDVKVVNWHASFAIQRTTTLLAAVQISPHTDDLRA
jgi:hypothetical protein